MLKLFNEGRELSLDVNKLNTRDENETTITNVGFKNTRVKESLKKICDDKVVGLDNI